MKLKFPILAILLIATTIRVTAQAPNNDKDKKLEFINFIAESDSFDGNIYLVNGKYYAADSIELLFHKLEINPETDVANVEIFTASNPYNNEMIGRIRGVLPQKYQNSIRGLFIFTLK